MESKKIDTYQMVTDRITALLEQGITPWARPWNSVKCCAWSGNDGREYSLLNQMMLADPNKKYTSMDDLLSDVAGEYVTYAQAQARGGQVRKGEKGHPIVFWKFIDKVTGQDADGNDITETIPFIRHYYVFHIKQCDGLEQKYHKDSTNALHDFIADKTADDVAHDYIHREGITYNKVKGDRAYYSPFLDTVVTPLPEQFADSNEYYSTLFHELTHSTGHKSRLNRLSDDAHFGNEVYSAEELVAEIGAASLMATLGLESEGTLNNSAAYVKGWLKALKNDKRMIVTAASRAEKAIKLILNIQ